MNVRDLLPTTITKTADGVISPLTREHQQRQRLYALYWSYYKGQHRRPIKVREGQADDNVTLNWSRKIVDAGVAFLCSRGVAFEIADEDDRSPEEVYLDTVWSDDPARQFSKALFLQALAQNGGVTGTAYIRLYPPTAVGGKPTLRAIDPALVHIITDPDDVDDVTGYHVIWKSGDVWKRQRIERQNGGLMWVIYDEEQTARSRGFVVVDELAWEYDFSPLFHCQNLIMANTPYGASDLEDADINDAINFVASNTNRIVRFHAHPKTIGTGFQANQLGQTAVDGFWTIPAADAKVYNLEMQTDLASSRQHKQDLEDAFHQIAGVPRLDPAQVNVGALSGFALQILYGPLLQKTAVKQQTYGGMLAQVNRALLILGGYDAGSVVNNKWPSPLPKSRAEQVQEFQALTAAGVDAATAAKIAGYSERDVDLIAQGQQMPNPMDAV